MSINHTSMRLMTTALIGLGAAAISSSSLAFEYDGPAITFEQIYENPDNNDLKLNYARQQAASGDLLGAASALEGMLFASPNWDSARLFYAAVLYELDDRASAMREFDLLDNRPLSSDQRALVASYRDGSAAPRKKGAKISGRVELGLRADDNAGNALIDSVVIAADRGDISVFARGTVKAVIPVTQSGGLNVTLGARGQTLRHETFSRSDYDTLGASAGLSGEMGGFFWGASADFDNVYISGDKYLTQMGPKLTLGTKLSDTTSLSVSGAHYYQDFEALSISPEERFRTGALSLVNVNLAVRPNEDFNYRVSAGYENKNATQNSLAYEGLHFGGNLFKGFDNGVYLKANARYRNLNFDALNFFGPTPIDRKDDQITARAGIGASLNKIGGALGMEPKPGFSRVYLETAATYTDLSSNIDIYDYENIGAELKLIWDF